MFTGLIDHIAQISLIKPIPSGVLLEITSQFDTLTIGESVAVDGTCLTVTQQAQHCFSVELSNETLDKTIAKYYQVGQQVNLERALVVGDRLGGHFVSGHIDQTAIINNIKQHNDFFEYNISGFAASNQRLLSTKGSISINGVSLTLNRIDESSCTVMLVPHTLSKTNLALLTVNNSVNIEFDLLAKIIARQTTGYLHEQSI